MRHLALPASFALLVASPVSALTNTTYIGPDLGLWSDPNNWSTGLIPNNLSGDTCAVLLNNALPTTTFLDISPTITTLTIAAPNTLSILPGNNLTLAGGTLSNSGNLLVNASGVSTQLILTATTTLSGAGNLLLTDPFSAINGPAGTRFTNSGLISGQGSLGLGNLKFNNTGTVVASTGTLSIQFFSSSTDNNFNTGILRADGGTLNIGGGQFTGNGTIEALNGSTVNLNVTPLSSSPTLHSDGLINLNSGGIFASITGNGTVIVTKGNTSRGILLNQLIITGSHSISSNATTGTSRLNSLILAGSTGNWTGMLNINTIKLIIQSFDASEKSAKFPVLVDQINSAFHNGDWMGNGIKCAIIGGGGGTNPPITSTLAICDNADLGLTTFGGRTVDSNSILLTAAAFGDANLDGLSNSADFDRWYAHILQHSYSTAVGDFNRDGGIDGLDFDVWSTYSGSAGAAYVASLGLNPATLSAIRATPVPEPASLTLLLAGSLLTLRRPPRKKPSP